MKEKVGVEWGEGEDLNNDGTSLPPPPKKKSTLCREVEIRHKTGLKCT